MKKIYNTFLFEIVNETYRLNGYRDILDEIFDFYRYQMIIKTIRNVIHTFL